MKDLRHSLARLQRWPLVGLLLMVIFSVLYARSMSPSIAGMGQGLWDSQEAQVAGTTWGMLHAPGYPLYVILCNVLNVLIGLVAPGTEPAWRVSLFSALCGAATVAVLHAIMVKITGRRAVSALSAALLGVSRTFWAMSGRAEVYSLETVLLVLNLWFLLLWDESGDDRWVPWIGLVLGSGTAHHRTQAVLALPLAVYMIWKRKSWRLWAKMAVFSLLPFLVYAYLPLIGFLKRPVLWRDPTTLSGLWYIFTSQAWYNEVRWPTLSQAVALTWEVQVEELGVWGVVGGMVGLLLATIREKRLAVILGTSAAGMILFGVPIYFSDYYLADYAGKLLLLTMLLAVGVGVTAGYACRLGARWADRLRPPWGTAGRIAVEMAVAGVLLAGVLRLGLANWPEMDQSGDYRGEDILRELACLDTLSDEPLLIMTETTYGLSFARYGRYVRGLDLTWPSIWDEHPDLAGPLARGQRVFLIKDMPYQWHIPPAIQTLLDRGRYYLAPTGNPDVQEVRDRFAALPAGVKMLNATFDEGVELAAYRYGLCRRRTGTSLRVDLWWRAARPLADDYRLKAHLLAADGQRLALGDQAHPVRGTHPTSWWWAGELILDETDLALPEGVVPPGARLAVGLYRVVGDQFPTIGQQIIPLK